MEFYRKVAHIGGSPHHQHQLLNQGSRPASETKKAGPQAPTERKGRTRGANPGQTMAQLTGKVAETKKLKRMAMRKARRRRRRRKKRRNDE